MGRRRRGITPIEDIAQHVEEKVNLIGIVLEFSFHRKSEGTDYVSVLKIVDQSQQNPELTVIIFTDKVEDLPVVKSPQDFIVLHNVTIKRHDGAVNAVSYKNSSFGLYDGNDSGNICYQTFGEFSLSWCENKVITNLRNWWTSTSIDSGNHEYLISMRDMNDDDYFDLVCKVLHISYDDRKGLWMLFVWDGTDVPLLTLNGKFKDEEKDPLPLKVESFPLPRDVLKNFSPVGTVLRVVADKAHENLGTQFQGVGKWVRIRGMTGKKLAGMWYGALNSGSRVRLLPDNDSIVMDCERKFKERISEHGRLPLWNVNNRLTVIEIDEMESIEFWTLMDVLAHEKDDSIFSCAVRMVAIDPFPDEEFWNGEEPVIRLILEDPTARIEAYLVGDELMKFCNGFPNDTVVAKMKVLLGVAEHQNINDDVDCTRYPPLVKCRLDSMPHSGNRVFFICHTSLA